MGFCRQGVGCRALLQGIFLTPGSSLTSPALAGRFFTTGATWEAPLAPQLLFFFLFFFHSYYFKHQTNYLLP